MKEHRDQRQKLLADTLDGEWATGSSAGMATRAAAHARRRRLVRRSVGTLAPVAALVALSFFVFGPHTSKELPSSTQGSNKTLVRNYTTISDDQLIDSMAPLLILPDGMGGKKIVLVQR